MLIPRSMFLAIMVLGATLAFSGTAHAELALDGNFAMPRRVRIPAVRSAMVGRSPAAEPTSRAW